MPYILVPKIIEELVHPWAANSLELNGQQYSASTNVSADGTDTAVGVVNIGLLPAKYPGYFGDLKEVEIGLTTAFKSANGDTIVLWTVQGRNLTNANPTNSSWVNLSAQQTQTRPVNTAFKDNSIAGLGLIAANFNRLPFELRVIFQGNTAGLIEARMKNSSYVRYLYQID